MRKDLIYIINRRLLKEVQKGLPITKTITIDQLERLERSATVITETLREIIREKKNELQKPSDDDHWLTADQVSKILDIHPKTVGRYCREKRLIGKKAGKGWKIKKSDLDKFN